MHDLAPNYISELLTPDVSNRNLRSRDGGLLSISESRLKTKDDKAFAVRAPQLWNGVPEKIRLSESVSVLNCNLRPTFIVRRFPIVYEPSFEFKFFFSLFNYSFTLLCFILPIVVFNSFCLIVRHFVTLFLQSAI